MTLGESNLVSLFWQNGAYASQLEIGQPVNLIGNLQINEWNGNQTPQFMVQDIAMDTLQILDYRSKSKNTDFLNNDETTAFMIQSKAQKLNENEFYYGETVPDHFEKMVLRDLPMTLDELKLTLQQTQISQVYIVFQHKASIYFEGMPSKEMFKKCYKALINKKEMNLATEGMMLCEFLNIKANILKFMLKVFLELGFINEDDGIITIATQPSKQDIESSQMYQSRLSRIEVEKLLLYDDFKHLNQWIKSHLGDNY